MPSKIRFPNDYPVLVDENGADALEVSSEVVRSHPQFSSPNTDTMGRRATVLDLLISPADTAVLQRVSAARHDLFLHLGGSYWLRWVYSDRTNLPDGGYTMPQLHSASQAVPAIMGGVIRKSEHWQALVGSRVTYVGADWVGVSQAGTFGGQYRRNGITDGVPGEYVEWTTQAGVTSIGLRAPRLSNGGLSLATITNSEAAPCVANLLPTAQDLVDDGSAPNTILAANGGYFQPTDRVYNSFITADVSGFDVQTSLAEDLPADTYTVRLTVAGEKVTAASAGQRLYVAGGSWSVDGLVPGDTDTEVLAEASLLRFTSAIEFVWYLRPTGGSSLPIGSSHGWEEPLGTTEFYIDGRSIQWGGDGERRIGGEITIVQRSTLYHPDGAGDDVLGAVATMKKVYRLTRLGLQISHETTWLVAGVLTGGYAAMFPLDYEVFDRGTLVTVDQDFPFGLGTGELHGRERADLMYLWSTRYPYAAALWVPDLRSVANWAYAEGDGPGGTGVRYAMIQDRAPGISVAKGYFTRVSGPAEETIVVDQITRCSAIYRIHRVIEPHAVLAR